MNNVRDHAERAREIARRHDPSNVFPDLTKSLARDIEQALREAAPEQGWRPIETAPKDGTAILAYSKACAEQKLLTRFGHTKVTWWRLPSDNKGYIGWGEFNSCSWPPTHWMPLPEPPETGSEG